MQSVDSESEPEIETFEADLPMEDPPSTQIQKGGADGRCFVTKRHVRKEACFSGEELEKMKRRRKATPLWAEASPIEMGASLRVLSNLQEEF